MKKIALILLAGIFLLSCKKEDNIIVTPFADAISLKIQQVLNDSTIVLAWNKYTGSGFRQYFLRRTATYLKGDKFAPFTDTVHLSTDVNITSFTENNMPLATDIVYELFVEMETTGAFIPATYVMYERPKSLVQGIVTDALINRAAKRLYITEQRQINVVNYTNGRVVNSKEYAIDIGFCGLGTYNGAEELYVPVNDGWLQVLDAVTLELKDRIYIAGSLIGSVVANNGKLYVSSTDRSFGGYSNCIKVYDRATKEMVSRTGYWDHTRLVQLDGSNVEFIDVTLNLLPTSVHYYKFAADGVVLETKEDTYHGDFRVSPYIIRSFPDGNHFITSSSGTIFDKSLIFDRYVKDYGTYTDFAFNSDGSIIYAADGMEKKIDIITYPATSNTGNFPTKFYPFKIFRDDNTLISVNRTDIHQQTTHILIETIKL